MQGVGNGKFCPNDCVTRGQLVTLLYRYSGETATKEELANLPFRDVKQGRFYTEPIAWAYARGIVKGYDANTFRPDQSVSRQEMSQIFYGYLSYLEVPLPDGTGMAQQYTDARKIAPWALKAVEQMTACGLLLGDTAGMFRPLDSSTRAQAATILMRLEELLSSASAT